LLGLWALRYQSDGALALVFRLAVNIGLLVSGHFSTIAVRRLPFDRLLDRPSFHGRLCQPGNDPNDPQQSFFPDVILAADDAFDVAHAATGPAVTRRDNCSCHASFHTSIRHFL